MGTIIKINLFLFLACILTSCNLGYFNENNVYVPKRPNFRLKDRPNMVYPTMLDTINIYRLSRSYYQGVQEYPVENNENPEMGIPYLKFYSNGRCRLFSIKVKDMAGRPNTLKSSDLDPSSSRVNGDYYYSNDGKKIQIESFVYGQGYGQYVILDYYLNMSGDTLIQVYKASRDIFVKEIIPPTWEKYPATW